MPNLLSNFILRHLGRRCYMLTHRNNQECSNIALHPTASSQRVSRFVRRSSSSGNKFMQKVPPNFWLNIYLMVGPLLLTVISTYATGLPLMGLFVVPGTFIALAMWIKSPSTTAKQKWRSLFLGCLLSYIFLGVLASQWP